MPSNVLRQLTPGMIIVHDGNRQYSVTQALADQFSDGDRIMFIPGIDEPILIPSHHTQQMADSILQSKRAFYELGRISDDQIDQFYDTVCKRLSNDSIWASIQSVNNEDVSRAASRGRSTTRLVVSDTMRQGMIAGVIEFKDQSVMRVEGLEERYHDGWSIDVLKSPLGVVGFVFEGRPNVIVDATGVLKSGNTVIFRVGQDALNTAREIMRAVITPALIQANLPEHAIQLIDSPDRSTAWALFSNKGLDLAVARGSGAAVRTLGSIAQQSGVPVSLHGTGGAWMMTSPSTQADRLHGAIVGSLDRKVCNTLNTLCILRHQVDAFIPIICDALTIAARGKSYKVHVASQSVQYINPSLVETVGQIDQSDGSQRNAQFEPIETEMLGNEWMWETCPEISLVVVEDVASAISLCNQYSPQFVASLITQNQLELMAFFNAVNAPFIGNGMTRWVDGQYALNAPELGLSNWESGRLFARSGILGGDAVFTTRIKMNQTIPLLRR